MIQEMVIKEIASYVNCKEDDVTMNVRLEDLGIDSLGAITILFELEDKLDIDIPTESIDTLKNVGDFVGQLGKLLEDKVPA